MSRTETDEVWDVLKAIALDTGPDPCWRLAQIGVPAVRRFGLGQSGIRLDLSGELIIVIDGGQTRGETPLGSFFGVKLAEAILRRKGRPHAWVWRARRAQECRVCGAVSSITEHPSAVCPGKMEVSHEAVGDASE